MTSRAPSPSSQAPLSTASADANHTQDDVELRQLVAAQAEAWNKGDATAWCKDFTADADFTNIAGLVFEGHEEIEKRHAGLFSKVFKGSQVKVTVRKITYPAADIAVVNTVNEITGHARLPPGVQETEKGLLRTQMKYVMKKMSGQWRILAGHNTDVKPGPIAP